MLLSNLIQFWNYRTWGVSKKITVPTSQ